MVTVLNTRLFHPFAPTGFSLSYESIDATRFQPINTDYTSVILYLYLKIPHKSIRREFNEGLNSYDLLSPVDQTSER